MIELLYKASQEIQLKLFHAWRLKNVLNIRKTMLLHKPIILIEFKSQERLQGSFVDL